MLPLSVAAFALLAPSFGAQAGQRFVVLPSAETVYAKPDLKSDGISHLAGADKAAAAPDGIAFRLIRERKGWLELETLPVASTNAHCAHGNYLLEGLKLRVFAPASARVPVLRRRVRLRWDDGTSLELAKGTPVFKLDGEHAAEHHGLLFRIPPPGTAAGKEYAPGGMFRVRSSDRLLSPDALADGSVSFGGARVEQAGFVGNIFIEAEEPRGSEVLATIGLRCVRLRALVPAGAIRQTLGQLTGDGEGEEGPSPAVGTRLFWRTGAPAGVVAGAFHFDAEDQPIPGKRCFKKVLRPRSADSSNVLRLCVPRGAVVR